MCCLCVCLFGIGLNYNLFFLAQNKVRSQAENPRHIRINSQEFYGHRTAMERFVNNNAFLWPNKFLF